MKRFYTFCKQFEIFTPFPVYEQLLCSFVAYLADEGLSPQNACGDEKGCDGHGWSLKKWYVPYSA